MCAQSATTVLPILGRSSAVINRANPCYSDTLLPRQLVAPAGPWRPPLRISANPSRYKERLGLLIPRLRPPGHLRLAFSRPGTSDGEWLFRHNFTVVIALLRLQSIMNSKVASKRPSPA